MLSGKSFLILAASFFAIAAPSLPVTCGRLEKVSAGEDHSLALSDDKTLWSCGGASDNHYQLGLGSGVYHISTLTQVRGENGSGYLRNIIAFDAGWYHSLAANSDGVCYSFGTDDKGQLGNGTVLGDWDVPRRINGYGDLGQNTAIVYVSAGRSGKHSLIVDSNGFAYAFGLNDSGQCGNGTSGGQEDAPVLVHGPNNVGYLQNIVAVDAGVNHSLALTRLNSGGYVWEWGENNDSNYPQKVVNLHNIIGISTCHHSVAVDSNGFVYEWMSSSPYKVPRGEMLTPSGYLENIVEVSAGYYCSLGRTSDGRVLVWNFGEEPQYIEAGDMNTPSGLLEGIVSIAAGYWDHRLAVSQDGYGWAWGADNDFGKFGVGDSAPHPDPTQMLCDEPAYPVVLIKTDDVDDGECRGAFFNNRINYSIYYNMNGFSDTNVVIEDRLPDGVIYYWSSHQCDVNGRTVTWGPWNLDGNDSDTITLTVEVTEETVPGSTITNRVKMYGDLVYGSHTEQTEICCYRANKIYIDGDANDRGDGATWQTAFNNLQNALVTAASSDCYSEIWVAAGTYKPATDANLTNASFILLDGVALIGHFAGGENSSLDRNLADANYESVLDGQIGQSQSQAV